MEINVGDKEAAVQKIKKLIIERRQNITTQKYFELGDDPDVLDKIDREFSEIDELFEALAESYSFEFIDSMQESNRYFDVRRITRDTQNFLQEVRIKGEGSRENTLKFLQLTD